MYIYSHLHIYVYLHTLYTYIRNLYSYKNRNYICCNIAECIGHQGEKIKYQMNLCNK